VDSRKLAMKFLMSPGSVLALGALGALTAAVSGVALSWDGSAYLFNALDSQQPFVPHGRVVDVLIQAPTLLAQTFTDRLGILRLVFGLSYLSIPVLALLASFIVVRRKPRMFIWPVLAVCVATLPGQVNPSSEALQSSQLIWPILLAAIVGLDRSDWVAWPAVVATGLYAAVAHPFGALLLGGVLLISVAYRRRSLAAVAAMLLVIAAANAWLTADPYQGDRITMSVITYGFGQAIAGAPLIAIVSSSIGGALIAIGDRTSHGGLLGGAGVACQALAIAALAPWAYNSTAWVGAIEFRTFTAAVIVPVALIAAVDGWREPTATSHWRQLAGVTAAVGFALIMAIQGLSVLKLDSSIHDAVRAANGGCTQIQNIEGYQGTMLDSWATPYRSLVLGGRTAMSIVIRVDNCQLLTAGGPVPVDFWEHGPLDAPGWFDLRRLIEKQ
jgi:hypothetical protein